MPPLTFPVELTMRRLLRFCLSWRVLASGLASLLVICTMYQYFGLRDDSGTGIVPPSDYVHAYTSGWIIPDDPGFIHYLRTHWLHGPSKTRNRLPPRDHSQYGENQLVEEIMGGRHGGFFVECGAGDGMTLSNTLLLELNKQWTGLLIEPDPYQYQKLLGKHRNVYSMNACANTRNRSDVVTFLPEANRGGVIDRISNEQKQLFSGPNNGRGQLPVQCFPLYSMLLAVGRTKIDFLSLDTGGVEEAQILETLPLKQLDIELFIINYGSTTASESDVDLESIRSFFEKVGDYVETGTYGGVHVAFRRMKPS